MCPKRKQPPKKLGRRAAFRTPKKTLLVYCEGVRTEPEYLRALKMLPEVREVAAVDIRIETDHGGAVPMTLVRLAIEAQRRSAEEEGEVDEFWCVFDVEWPTNHPNLLEAVQLAQTHGVQLAISNPCFELWLALHFADQSAWLSNDDARRLRRRLDGQDDKGLPADRYMPLRQDAMRRAAALRDRHEQNDTPFPQDNPSSGVFRLLASVGA